MKKITFNIIIFIIASWVSILSCSEDKETIKECNPSGISADITFRKIGEKCKDIDILWDISFGVNVEFEVDLKCETDCSENMIFYHTDKVLKTQAGIIDLESAIRTTAIYKCNNVFHPSQTLYMQVDDPGPINYMVGDTIRWDFFDARLCLAEDIHGCGMNNQPIDLPDFSFEYIIIPEDFECE